MTRTDDTERRRLERRFGAYARSARKQNAWSAANAGNEAMRAEVAERILPFAASAARILDAGCGNGWWLERLQAAGNHGQALHGIELLHQRAAAASARVPSAQIIEGDVRALPFDDESFDVVTMFTVLSSMPSRDDARQALAECRRVLAPGGLLAVWDVRVTNPANRATIRVRRSDYEAVLGPGARFERVTLLPPLARRLPAALYPRLAALRPLTTHWLVTAGGRSRS